MEPAKGHGKERKDRRKVGEKPGEWVSWLWRKQCLRERAVPCIKLPPQR